MQESRTHAVIVVTPDLEEIVADALAFAGTEHAVVLLEGGRQDVLSVPADAGVLVLSGQSGHANDPAFWQELRTVRGGVPVIVVTGDSDVPAAVQLMRAGAHDVVESAGCPGRLAAALRSALGRASAETDAAVSPRHPRSMAGLVGVSPALCAIRDTIASVAPSDAGVFVVGESGTGKELVARALHLCSRRSAHPFLAINCAALPRDILENELFGHERGAFTGALLQKAGCFELASGGTLFLDEIGEMTSETQAKLLRVIEQQSFRRLGGKEELRVDVRIIAATNRDVERSLEDGIIRPDLYYRLSVVEMVLPPLRSRREDIPPLVEHFVGLFAGKYGKRIDGVRPACLDFMVGYDWPGNVRELRNAIERAVVICDEGRIDLRHLPEKLRNARPLSSHITLPIGISVDEAEKRLILETLASVGNNKARAARILGVSRKTLHNKLNSFAGSAPDGADHSGA